MLADIFLPKVDQFEKVWFKMADSTSKFYKIDEMNILYWRGLFLNELSTFEKDEELKLQFAVNSMHQFDLLLENCFQPEKLNELAKNRCEETHTIFINATHCNNLNHLVVIGNYTQHVLQNIVPDVYQWLDKTNKMRQKYLFQMKSFINYMDQCKEKPINVSEVYYNIGEQHRHIILTNRNLQLEQLSYSTPFIEKYCVSEQMRLAKLSLKLGEPMESFFRSTLKKIDSSRFIVRFRQKLWTPDYGY